MFIIPKYGKIKGGSKPPSPPAPLLLPPNSKDARRSTQTLEVIDLLCEGPIAGIVDKQGNIVSGLDLAKGIYLNDTPIINESDEFNFRRVSAEFKEGLLNPSLFSDESGFNEIEQTISKDQTLTGSWDWSASSNTEDSHAGDSSRDVRGEREFGTWRGQVDIDEFPEEDPYLFTHTSENTFVNEIDINIKVSQLFDTISQGSGSGKSGDLGTRISSTVNFEIKGGYFEDDNNQVTVTTIQKSVTGLITQSAYGITETVDVGESEFNDKRKWVSVRKLSSETLSPLVARTASVSAIIERITSPKLYYPNAALVASKYDARTFPQLPQRTFDCKLKVVRIPSNYNSESSSYSGIWDGTFKWGWTDNPAWVLYDLVTNNTYGIGDFLDANLIDKWTLYSIGRYCDAVDDSGNFVGINGRPRFSCNLIITRPQQAFELINQIASIFRAFMYWQDGGLHFASDIPKDPLMHFSNVDADKGQFFYSEAAKNTRFTVAEVQYNDETDNYTPKIESVEDPQGISELGPIIKKVEGVGVTNKDQARRLGLHMIYSSRLETETVSFSTNQKALYLKPGDIISIQDQLRSILRNDGKILDVVKNTEYTLGVLVDQDLTSSNASTIKFSTPVSHNKFQDFDDFFGATVEEQLESIRDLRTSQFSEYKIGSIRKGEVDTFEMDCNSRNLIVPMVSSALIYGAVLNKASSSFTIIFDSPIEVGDSDIDLTYEIIRDAMNDSVIIARDVYGNVVDKPDIVINYEGDGYWGEVDADLSIGSSVGVAELHWGFKPLNENGEQISILQLKERFECGDYSYTIKLNSQNLKERFFRVITIAEEEKNKYNINAVAHDPNKFNAIEGDFVNDTEQYSFGGLNSTNLGLSQPITPEPTSFTITENNINATTSDFDFELNWKWAAAFDSIERFDITMTTPSGSVRYFSVLSSAFISIVSGDYLYELVFSDLAEVLSSYEYGSYKMEIKAISKAPYFIQSKGGIISTDLAVSPEVILRDYYVINSFTALDNESESYTFDPNVSSSFGNSIVNKAPLEANWTLLDPLGATLSDSQGFSSSSFNISQKVSILNSGSGITSISGEQIDGLSYFASRSKLLTALGSEDDLRDYKLKFEIDSSLSATTFESVIDITNPKPSIDSITVLDANTPQTGNVILDIDFSNNGGQDMQYIEIYTGSSSGFTADSNSLITSAPLSPSATSVDISLTSLDGQPSDSYLFYKAAVFDSVGQGVLFETPKSGILLPAEDDTGTIDELTDSVSSLTDEVFLKYDFRGKSIDFEDSHYDTDGVSSADSSYSRLEVDVAPTGYVRGDFAKNVSVAPYLSSSSRFDQYPVNLFFEIGGELPAHDHELTFMIGSDSDLFESTSGIPVFDENSFGVEIKIYKDAGVEKLSLKSSFGDGNPVNLDEGEVNANLLSSSEPNNFIVFIDDESISFNQIDDQLNYSEILNLPRSTPFSGDYGSGNNLNGLQFWSRANTVGSSHKNTLESVYFNNTPVEL